MKKFNDSYNQFIKWREKNLLVGQCHYQIEDGNVMIEKWTLFNQLKENTSRTVLIEFYPDGNGFSIYEITE